MEKEKAKKTKPTRPANWGGGASWSTQRGLPNVRRGEELLGGPAPHTRVAAHARRKWGGAHAAGQQHSLPIFLPRLGADVLLLDP